ncbi:MAG TPA: hypothetical protein DCL38_02705 [Lachnospiraceae bacterium]|nr:hypothetical protein [Lachnospiraceae bacterium]
MDCQEANGNISRFIDDGLTGDELSAFLLHIDTCRECYEELETNYLIKESLSRLEVEEGASFNIHEELHKKLKVCEQLVGLHNIALLSRRVILLIAALCVGICIVSMYL